LAAGADIHFPTPIFDLCQLLMHPSLKHLEGVFQEIDPDKDTDREARQLDAGEVITTADRDTDRRLNPDCCSRGNANDNAVTRHYYPCTKETNPGHHLTDNPRAIGRTVGNGSGYGDKDIGSNANQGAGANAYRFSTDLPLNADDTPADNRTKQAEPIKWGNTEKSLRRNHDNTGEKQAEEDEALFLKL